MIQRLFLLVFFMGSQPVFCQQWSLQQVIDTAIKNNYNVRLSAYDVKHAQSKIEEAKSSFLPKINTMVDYRYYSNLPYQLLPAGMFGGIAGTYKEAQFGLPHNFNANVQLTYPLYNPVLKANLSTIKSGAAVTELQQIKSQEDIALEVSNVYYNAQVLISQLSFIDSNISNSKKLMLIMELLYQQKMAKGTDVEKVNLQLSQLFSQKETIESQYSQVINMLKFMLGKSQADEILIASNPGSSQYQLLIETSLTEIKLAEQQINFLQTEKKTIQQSKLPIINLNGFYGTAGFAKTGANDFFKFYPLGYAGMQLLLPLYSGNVTNRKIKSKEVELEKAALKVEMIKEKYAVDKINNVQQLTISTRNLQTIQQQINLAQRIYQITLLQQKNGVASLTDVLLADTALREAQQNYILSLIALRRAELENKKLTGNLIIK